VYVQGVFRAPTSSLSQRDLTGLWGLHRIGNVARDEPVHDGLPERLVQRDVYIVDRAGGKALRLLAVESAHVGGCKILELEAPESGGDVVADYALIPHEGRAAHRALYRIGELAAEVLTNGERTSVIDEATVPVCPGLVESHLSLGLART
jgi:hypothetical protein